MYLPLIKALAVMAALLHDWGKATLCFQRKLQVKQPPDPLRHEWVSLLLFRALIQDANNDSTWLQRLAEGVWDETPLMSAAGQNVKSRCKTTGWCRIVGLADRHASQIAGFDLG